MLMHFVAFFVGIFIFMFEKVNLKEKNTHFHLQPITQKRTKQTKDTVYKKDTKKKYFQRRKRKKKKLEKLKKTK